MKRLGAIFVAASCLSSLVACGGSSGDKNDMAACGPVTCSAVTAFNPKTCQCEAVDAATVMDLSQPNTDL